MKGLTQRKQLLLDVHKEDRSWVYPSNQRIRGEDEHETSY